MKNRSGKYPELSDDLLHLAKWMRRKIEDRLQGREYMFTRDDFQDVSKGIRYWNWLAPRHAHKKWFPKMMDNMFGPVQSPKIRSRIIPLNVETKKSKGAVLPDKLIDDFIDSAGFLIILNECLCRRGMECKDYPIDFGCLMLGEGARTLLKGNHGREVTAKEAKKHVREAQKYGLVPIAAHAKQEEQVMGIPVNQRHNFIELCLCCPCCCVALKNLKYCTPDVFRHNFINVGFVAKALPDCKGCNKCVSICPPGAIKKNGNKVWVNEDKCVGCGVCQHACEHDAIQLVQIGKPRGELLDYFDGLKLDLS